MSDIEDGELLSSDSEDCIQPLSQKEETSKNKVKNYVDTNNNQTYLIDRNFPKNDESNRSYRKRDSNSPKYYDRKRKHHNKLELIENKKHRKSNEHKDKEYISPKKPEIVETNIDYQKIEEPNPPTKRKILCKYYASGECKNGPGCAFMHEEFPCKFFHDKTTNCRAGDECKYSHAPLSDDMKSVMVSFIQDGKEHKPTFSTSTFNTNVPVHNRTKCLLPTPVLEPQVSNLSQTQFHKPVLYGDFCDTDPYEEPLLHNSNNYPTRYVNSTIRNSYSLNKPRLVDQDYRINPLPNNYSRIQSDFIPQNNFMPTIDSVGKSYSEHYRHDFNSTNFGPISPPEINFQEPPPYDVGINQQQTTQPSVSYNNHAPARFIVGINKNVPKTIDNTMEENFKKALKLLADSVTLPEISSNSDNLKSNNENQENVPFEKIQETSNSYPIKSEKVTTFTQNEKKPFKNNYTRYKTSHSSTSQTKVLCNSKIQENTVPGSIHQDTLFKSFIKQESTNHHSFVSDNVEYSPIPQDNKRETVSYSPVIQNNKRETVSYSPVTQDKTLYSSIHQNIKQENVSYSPVLSNIKHENVSYSPVLSNNIQENVSYSPVPSNAIQEKVSYSPIQPEKITYSSAPPNIKQEAVSSSVIQQDKVLESESNNLFKEEPIPNPAIRIAENVSIFNINENELSDSERQYIEEMRSLINLDAQFENRIPWVARKLEPTLKQPYILYRLKVNDVHENAISDPRLSGHPVLYELEALNDPDEIPDVNHVNNSTDDDNNVVEQDYLQIDITSSVNQSKPPCDDTLSYLYNYKIKKERVSGEVLL